MKNLPKIQFKHVTKRYSSARALNRVDLKIPKHQIFVIVGPSGSGKSTLLKLINRLIKPTSGQIWVDGKLISRYPVKSFRLKMGNLLQGDTLFPNLNVGQNVTIQLKVLHVKKARRAEIAEGLLDQVGLAPKYGSRYPSELSGGEQQRVGVARALATQPRLILMDEPFSALDLINRKRLQNLVLKLHRKLHNTILFVTHDMHEAEKMGDQIAVLYHGRIVQTGTTDNLLWNPRTPLVNKLFHQRSIRNLVQKGYAKPVERAPKGSLTPVNRPIPQLAELLRKNSQVFVKYRYQFWQITVRNFLAFMSRRKDDRHE